MKNLLFFLPAMLAITSGCGSKPAESKTDDQSTSKVEKFLQKVDPYSFSSEPLALFEDGWFLLTAGSGDSFNPMTISWGGLGTLWGSPVATIYVRPSRHTFGFMENGSHFTLCAFDDSYREMLNYMGSHSGRDADKVKEAGLTPLKTELGNQYYQEAELVIECEKIFYQDLSYANLMDEKAKSYYKNEEGLHRMYVGKIVNIWQKK